MKHLIRTLILCALALILIQANNTPFEKRATYGGMMRAVSLIDNYAVINQGETLAIIDRRDPENPVKTGALMTGHLIKDIAAEGNYAYIAEGEGGLIIVDISNKNNPQKIIQFQIGGDAERVIIEGDYAYVVDRFHDDLIMINISDAHRPYEVGRYESGSPHNAVIRGDYAYIAESRGLVIVDISNKSRPREVGIWDKNGSMEAIAIQGDYAYIGKNDMYVVDISEKKNPHQVGFLDMNGKALLRNIVIEGDYAYFIDTGRDSYSDDEKFKILDISNRLSPQLIGKLYVGDMRGGEGRIAIGNNHAYMIDKDKNGLLIIDISKKSNLWVAGNYYTPNCAYSIATEGNYTYVGDFSGFGIADISNENTPKDISYFKYSESAPGRIAVSGDFAYMASEDGLLTIDIIDKDIPRQASFLRPKGSPVRVAVQGEYVYLTVRDNLNTDENEAGLSIINMSNKYAPYETAHYTIDLDMSRERGRIVVKGDYAYIANYVGLIILDISDQHAPHEVSRFGSEVQDVAVEGDYAYLAEEEHLTILNISNKKAPYKTGQFDFSSSAQFVGISGDFAYIMTFDYGGRHLLKLIDIHNKFSPKEMGYYDFSLLSDDYASEFPYDMVVIDNFIYIADADNGLIILENIIPPFSPKTPIVPIINYLLD